ncbi:hypothetical protein OG535_27690 [Kitasatospora sp. NBC_00085]|uniref:hypothetical protein n=1 Tax=unclassified Kitasatospora TaxID=2633591 RepID=UPI003254B779
MTRESGGRQDGLRGDGPGRVDARAREDRFADQEEFARRTLAAADFPVYGVAYGVSPEGDALAAFETSDGLLSWVEVRSGDWASADGPYVTVRTHRPGADRPGALPELEDVVEDERDRVYEQLGVDEGDCPGRVRALREWITVDGEPQAVEVHEDRRELWDRPDVSVPGVCPKPGAGPVWAVRLRVGGLTVTVCGRGVPPGGLELAPVEDVERYLRGRTALLRLLASRRGRHVPVEERELVPATGLEAHRAVIEHGIAESAAIEAQVRAGRTPRLPRGLRGEAGALRWEAAVRQQMRLASESREEAVAAVTAMVNHLNRLSRQTQWVVGTPEGEAAVEEVIRYTVFASEVASLPAQRAWAQLWRDRPACEGDSWEERLGEQLWLSAWEQWRAARAGRSPR